MTSYEVNVASRGQFPDSGRGIERCDANSTAGSLTDCQLKPIKRGNWDIWVRSVNSAGLSDWLLGASASINSCTQMDATAGSCEVYDKGPGGGLVVYDAGARQPWGRYLEVARAGWNGTAQDPAIDWCPQDARGFDSTLATGTAIGTGAANTALIIDACGQSNAAAKAASYRGAGFDDWFLPSADEASRMYDLRTQVGGLDSNLYWTSTQNPSEAVIYRKFAMVLANDYGALLRNRSGDVIKWEKFLPATIRPFRAF